MKRQAVVRTLPEGSKQRKLFVISVVAVLILLAGLYLSFAWNRYQSMFEAEAIKLAESLEALLPDQHISDLVAKDEDPNSVEYAIIRKKLIELVEKTKQIHYAYLLCERDGEPILLVDSRPAPQSPYSPLEGFEEGIPDRSWVPFQAQRSILTKPFQNEWGSWIRALVPLEPSAGGRSTAILGLSYSAAEWNKGVGKRMIPDIIVTLSLLMILCAFLYIVFKHEELKEKSRQLAFDEQLYRSVFQQAPIGITLNDYKCDRESSIFVSANPAARQILGVEDELHLRKANWMEMSARESLEEELRLFEQFKNKEIDGYSFEKNITRPDGSSIWVQIKVSSFIGSEDSDFTYLCLIEDISARKAMEETLRESERSKSVLLSHLPGMAYRSHHAPQWAMEFVSAGCEKLTGYPPEDILHNRERSFYDIVSPEYRKLIWEKCARAVEQRQNFRCEYEILAKSGERKWVLELGQGIYDPSGRVEAMEGIILDISEQKKRDAQITYLNECDFLTGLYNRSYLEQEKERLSQPDHLPLSIAICDINGLRMINDAYGQAQGDRLIMESAKLLKNLKRPDDVLGRVGGGEFMLLMPNTGSEEAHALLEEAQATIESYNRSKREPLYEISLAIGQGTLEAAGQSLKEAVKEAESHLKHRKLLSQKSLHHSILSSIMATLYAKSQETEEHGKRLGQYAVMIGTQLGLEQKELDDLQLLSMLHDIGKIGIDNSILNKPGPLAAEEWGQMKKHPEIGYRIAMSTPELEHVADYILRHHERWDGTGYPGGIRGDDIPLFSRILAVADAYDAMTENRTYRRALAPQVALDEINKNAGSQFDPELAALFVQQMEDRLDRSAAAPT